MWKTTSLSQPSLSMSCLWIWTIEYFRSYSITDEEVEDNPDSPELELLWLRLRARSRGAHRDISALVADAKNTTHFARHREHDLVTIVYGH